MKFANRRDAAMRLIRHLEKYKNEDSIVLAIPRGGVPIAFHVARKFRTPLELLMTKKIGHPANEELAIGAVSLEGHIIDETLKIPQEYISSEVQKIRESLKERYRMFMGDHPPADIKNKTVIIIDDGIATGNTILSAIQMLRQKNPKKIVVAVPVAPPHTASKIRRKVDDLICLFTPETFIGVSYHYHDFSEVSDEEVIQLIREANHFEDVA